MRSAVILGFSLLAACAAPQPTGDSPAPESERVRVGGATTSGLRVTSNTMARVDTIWTHFDRVWRIMPAVFATLDVPIERYDAEQGLIGNMAHKVYRRLGQIPLTRYLDCGQTQIGPNADSYEVVLTLLARVQRSRADTSNTTVTTTVEALARPVQFRGDYVRCSSKGTLEARVNQLMKIELAPAP